MRTGDKVIKMKYHHIVREWTIPEQNIEDITSSTLMRFDNIILLGEGNRIYVLDEKESPEKEV